MALSTALVVGSGTVLTDPGRAPVAAQQLAAGVACAKSQVGVVRAVKNGLQLRRAGRWQKARKGTALYRKDRLRTKSRMRAVLQFCDKSGAYINHATDMQLPDRTTTEIKSGEVRQIVPAGKQHQIVTGQADAFGPDVDVQVHGSTTVFVDVRGLTQIENGHGSVELHPNQETTVHTNAAPGPPRHVDATRTISWTASLPSPIGSPPTPHPTPTPTSLAALSTPTSTATSTPAPSATPTPTTISPPGTPVGIGTFTLPEGEINHPYNQTLTATGGSPPYSWLITGGALPTGLSLTSTGTISGTPAARGNFLFLVQVTDSAGATATRELGILVQAPPSIVTSSLPLALVKRPYSASISASGGVTPYSFGVVSGSLPPGLSMSSDGTISGTPSQFGTYQFTVQVQDALGSTASRAFTLNVSRG